MDSLPQFTVEGIQEGDPGALAALCMTRSAAVFAYCEYVAADGQAQRATADAFCLFREQVWIEDDPDLNLEAALLAATRRCAAVRMPVSTATGAACSEAHLLVDWMHQTLSPADHERIEGHVASCSSCLDALMSFEAAERAYERPPKAPLPQALTRLVVMALLEAAPVSALQGDVVAVREALMADIGTHGLAPREAPTAVPAADREMQPRDPAGRSTAGAAASVKQRPKARRPRARERFARASYPRRRDRGRAIGAMTKPILALAVVAILIACLLLFVTLDLSSSASRSSKARPPSQATDARGTLRDTPDELSSKKRSAKPTTTPAGESTRSVESDPAPDGDG